MVPHIQNKGGQGDMDTNTNTEQGERHDFRHCGSGWGRNDALCDRPGTDYLMDPTHSVLLRATFSCSAAPFLLLHRTRHGAWSEKSNRRMEIAGGGRYLFSVRVRHRNMLADLQLSCRYLIRKLLSFVEILRIVKACCYS